MFYSILLPIIVIISLAGIVIFLFKKAPRVATLREGDIESRKDGESRFRKLVSFFGSSLLPGLRRWTSVVMAFLIKEWKGIFGKAGRKIADVREKRKAVVQEEQIPEEVEETAIDKLEKYEFDRKRRKPVPVDGPDEEEKEVRPMISERVVSPRSKSEIKDMLEDVLIERIALNPKDVEAYERLGEYYIEIGNYEHAKECVKQVIKLNPGNRDAKYKLRRLERIIHG